jgi:betaine-homocysteine S-methyltransferase
MFEEQVGWAADAGVDYVIGETFSWAQEAIIAVDVIKRANKTAVITLVRSPAIVTRLPSSARKRSRWTYAISAAVAGLGPIIYAQ